MPITPVMLLRQDGYSAQSTPSRSHAASCVTVNGDSDEDYQRTPVKQQRTPVATCSSSSTKQVLWAPPNGITVNRIIWLMGSD
jgi:hypothetical protein